MEEEYELKWYWMVEGGAGEQGSVGVKGGGGGRSRERKKKREW